MLSQNQLLQKGRYRIITSLTETTYEAYESLSEKNVLLKEIQDNTGFLVQKAAVLTALKHDSFSQIYNIFAESAKCFVVYEKAVGNTLSELIEKDKKPFSLSEMSNLAEQMLDTISYLHSQNPPLFYGNLNPQNIILNKNIKLLPDGLVQNLIQNGTPASGNQQFETKALAFSPLEQIWKDLDSASQKVILNSFDEQSQKILEQPANAQSDLYAIGAILYYLATARLPIDALTRSIELLEGKNDPLLPPNKLNPFIPREISDFLMKSLEIKREKRFSSAAIMRQILRAALANAMSETQDEKVLEIPSAEPKTPQFAKPIEVEQKSQIEIIKQQLREAEAKRLEAEKRAAEAEKLLLERESQSFNAQEFSAIIANPEEKFPPITDSPTIAPEFAQNDSAIESSADDFDGMFSQPEKNNKSYLKMAVGAVVLLALGGAAWGIWSFSNTNTLQTTQTSSFNTTVAPVPMPEKTPLPNDPAVTEQTIPTPEETPADSTSAEDVKTSVNPAQVKNKTAPTTTPPPTKKQTPTPPKTAETKKKLTLDDLIKDN